MHPLQSFPSASGIAESIVEVIVDALLGGIEDFTTDFLDWFAGVRDPTEQDVLVDAWFSVFEISVVVLVVWVVLGLLSFPFGNDEKTSLYRFGWRFIGVVIIWAVAQPAFAFGAELSNVLSDMILNLTADDIDVGAEFDTMTDRISSSGAVFGLLAAALVTAILMPIAQGIIVAVILVIDYVFFTAFIFSPLLAVFWAIDWGPLKKAHEFAQMMFDAAIGSLLYPVAISVFSVAYVVLIAAGVEGGTADAQVSAVLELIGLAFIYPILLVGIGIKLLSQVGNDMYGLSTVAKMAGVATMAGAGAVVGGVAGAAGGQGAMAGAKSGALRAGQGLARGGMGPTNEPISTVGRSTATAAGGSAPGGGGTSVAPNGGSPTGSAQANGATTEASGGEQQTPTAATGGSEEPKRGGLLNRANNAISERAPDSVSQAADTAATQPTGVRPSANRELQQEQAEAADTTQSLANRLDQTEEGDTVDLNELEEQGVFEEAEAPAPADSEQTATVDEDGWITYQDEEGNDAEAKTDNLAHAASRRAERHQRMAQKAGSRADYTEPVAKAGSKAASHTASGAQFAGQMGSKTLMMGARDAVMGHPGYTDFSMGGATQASGRGAGSDSTSGDAQDQGEIEQRASASVSPAYFQADRDDRLTENPVGHQTLSDEGRVDLEGDEELAVVHDPEQSQESEAAQVGWTMSASDVDEESFDSPEERLEHYRENGTRIARADESAPDIPTQGMTQGYANVGVEDVDGEESVVLDGRSGELAENEVRPGELDDVESGQQAAVRGEYQESPGGSGFVVGPSGGRTDLQGTLDQTDPGEQTLVTGGVRDTDGEQVGAQESSGKVIDPDYQPSTERETSTKQKQRARAQKTRAPKEDPGGVIPLGKQGIGFPTRERETVAGESVDYVGPVETDAGPLNSTRVEGMRVSDETPDGRFSDEDGNVDIGEQGNVVIQNAELQDQGEGYYQVNLTDETVIEESPRDLSAHAVEEYGDEEVSELRWGSAATTTEQLSLSNQTATGTLNSSERAVFDGESVDITGTVDDPDLGPTEIEGIDIRDTTTDSRFSGGGDIGSVSGIEDGENVTIENAQYTVELGPQGTEQEVVELTDQSRITRHDEGREVEPTIRRGEATATELARDQAPVEERSISTDNMDYIRDSQELEGTAVAATGVVDERPDGGAVLRGTGEASDRSIELSDETQGEATIARVGEGALSNVEAGDEVTLDRSISGTEGRSLRLTEHTDVTSLESGISEGQPPTVQKDYAGERLTEDRSAVRSFDSQRLARTDLESAFDAGEEVSMSEARFVEGPQSGRGPNEMAGHFETPDGQTIGEYGQLESDVEPTGDQLEHGSRYEVSNIAVDEQGRFKPSPQTEFTRVDSGDTPEPGETSDDEDSESDDST